MQQEKENRGGRCWLGACYAWLMLPFVLFALGWLKWFIAWPVAALVCLCFGLMLKHAPALWTPAFDKKNLARLGVIVLFAAGWVFFSGIGRFSYQSEDHLTRNGIFRMLVEQSWPLVDMAPPAEYYDGPVALAYYIGFWLPSALVGKLFGLGAGYAAQYLWAAAGVLLFYWLVLAAGPKKLLVWPLVVFILFSGMDWAGVSLLKGQLVNVITATPHLDNWPDYFQYTSFTSQLYWVFNQALAAWVATLLLYVQKSNRALAMIVAVTFISSTIPAVGLAPLALYFAFRNWKDAHGGQKFDAPDFVRGLLTPENAVGVLAAGLSYLYLGSNNAGQRFSTLFHIAADIWWLWLLFIALEVLVFYALLYPYHKKEPLFYIMLALQLALPWLRLGDKADLCMRGSIPILVILFLWVVDALRRSFKEKYRPVFLGLCAVLLIGSATAETEMMRSLAITWRAWRGSGPPVAQEEWHPMDLSWRDNFYGSMEGKFFYRWLMKGR